MTEMYIKKGKYGGDNKNGKYSRDKVYWKNKNMVVTKKNGKYGRYKFYRKTRIWSWQNL